MSVGVGDVLAERYEILEPLGKGGMGEVYAARDRKLRRRVAIKTIPAGSAGGSLATDRLRAEAEMLAQLEHPGIVVVHDVVEEADRVLLVMELIDGTSLRERLKRGPLPATEVADVVVAVGSALAAAHARDLVHRDVKPDNVMVRADGRIALLDFGIAKEVRTSVATSPSPAPVLTEPGAFIGTPMYIAPEQAQGVPVSAATDQFSLAVVAYELLCGHVPWPSESLPRLVAAIIQMEAPPIAPGRDLDPEVDVVLGRALAKRPQDRYPSTGEFADRLGAALRRRPTTQTVRSGTIPPVGTSTTVDSAGLPVTSLTGARPVTLPPPRARLALRAGLVAVVLAGGTFAAVRVAHLASGTAARSSPSGRPSTSTEGVSRIADLPSSQTAVPAAQASYGRGMQLLARGEFSAATMAFDAAIAADPAYASAHLQRLVGDTYFCPTDLPDARAHFQAASRARGTLSPRDQEVLDAIEPAVLDPPDLKDVAARLHALSTKRPGDAQIVEMVAIAENKLFHFAASADAVRRETALDAAEAVAGPMILAQDVERDEARAALDDCLHRNSAAEWCRVEKISRYANTGACQEMETEARSLMVFDPESNMGPRTLVSALAGENASMDALAVAYAEARSRLAPAAQARAKTMDDMMLALWGGDFTAALAGLDALGTKTSPSLSTIRVEVLWESGDRRAASEAALAYVKEAVALPRFERPESDPMPHMLARAREGGALPDVDFVARRDAWIESWHRRLDAGAWTTAAPVVWAQAFAYPTNEAEARGAVERLASFGPVPPMANRRFWTDDAPIGELLFLGGRHDDGLPRLRLGAARCGISMTPIRGRLWLGRALESTGDVTGACESYAAVLGRWGSAKPRSVTADAASARFKALGCRK